LGLPGFEEGRSTRDELTRRRRRRGRRRRRRN
jgi:hypothetical protein